jgi:hypothetical protein
VIAIRSSVLVPGLSQQEFKELLLSVGKTTRDRRPLSPVEVGELCAKSVAAGASVSQITEALQMTDRGMVVKFQRLLDLVPGVRHLVSWGHSGDGAIGFSTAAELARMSDSNQEIAAEAVLRNRLTRDEMRSVIQLLDRSGDTLEECIERVVRRRPVIRLRQIVLGAVTVDSARKSLASLSQNRRDDILEQVVRRLFPRADKFTSKLGIDRFAIIGGKSVAETVAAEPQIERLINAALEEDLS